VVRVSDADPTDETALHRERAILYLAIGSLLVLSPTVVGPVGDTLEPNPSYTYEAVEVTVQNGTLAFDGPPPDDGIEGVDCFGDYSTVVSLGYRVTIPNLQLGTTVSSWWFGCRN